MTATWAEQLIAWIEIWIDSRDDRFSYVSDLREQLTIGEVSTYTLDRAIVQLQSFSDRTRLDFRERSILFAQFADLLDGITRPSVFHTSIEHEDDRSTVYSIATARHWHRGESIDVVSREEFPFTRSYYGKSYKDSAIAFYKMSKSALGQGGSI